MLKAVGVVVLGFIVGFTALDYAFSMPEVYKSYSTNECVKVENYPGVFFNTDSNYSCENLPEKYDHVWTK